MHIVPKTHIKPSTLHTLYINMYSLYLEFDTIAT